MVARSRSWSSRARRDFDEREDYRKRKDEKDRYESDDRKDGRETRDREERSDRRSDRELERDAREDRMEERGYYHDEERLSPEDREALLMEIRNANPDDDVNEKLDRLRREYDYYERELDRYDADYDDLIAEMNRLKEDNRRYMMRDARKDLDTTEERQDKDIRQDNDAEKSFDDLWEEREG